MQAEQREKIQHAIQALIDVESALHHTGASGDASANLTKVQQKLSDARTALVELNAPDYN